MGLRWDCVGAVCERACFPTLPLWPCRARAPPVCANFDLRLDLLYRRLRLLARGTTSNIYILDIEVEEGARKHARKHAFRAALFEIRNAEVPLQPAANSRRHQRGPWASHPRYGRLKPVSTSARPAVSPAVGPLDQLVGLLYQPTSDRHLACQVALSQDFRKFAKESKAGADQEKISKMAGVAEKNPGFLAILQ